MGIEPYVKGLQHIGIPTKEMEKMVRFLSSLGFQKIREELQPSGGAVAFLELKNLVLEVYEDEAAPDRLGTIQHIALDVKGVDTLFEEMKKQGFYMVEDGVQQLPYWDHGIRYFIVEGPDQLRIEFAQKLS